MVLRGHLRVVFAERDVMENAALRQANVDVRAGGGGKKLRRRHADHVLAVLEEWSVIVRLIHRREDVINIRAEDMLDSAWKTSRGA
jgi:hypothetical protein